MTPQFEGAVAELKEIMSAVDAFVGAARQHDDITALILLLPAGSVGLAREADPEAGREQEVVLLAARDRIAQEAVAGGHLPGKPLLEPRHRAEIEVHPIVAARSEIREDAEGLRERADPRELVAPVVAEVALGRVLRKRRTELRPVVVQAAHQIQVGAIGLDGLEPKAAAEDDPQVQVLEFVVLVLVEEVDEQSRFDVPVIVHDRRERPALWRLTCPEISAVA